MVRLLQYTTNIKTCSLDTMMEYFGRLPVRERSWVRHVMAVPDTSSNAYMRNANTVYKGPVNSLSVFQHETAHAVDHFKNGKEVSSATDAFHKAFEKDTCVPDSYARACKSTNFREIGIEFIRVHEANFSSLARKLRSSLCSCVI